MIEYTKNKDPFWLMLSIASGIAALSGPYFIVSLVFAVCAYAYYKMALE